VGDEVVAELIKEKDTKGKQILRMKSGKKVKQLEGFFFTSLRARAIPLKVSATFVKLAIPPPIMRILPSGFTAPRVINPKMVLEYS